MSSIDTVITVDPVTGTEEIQLLSPRPLLVNGKRIYNIDTLKTFPSIKSSTALSEKLSVYLFNSLKKHLDSLDDGNYVLAINNTVIDDKGKLMYYEFDGIKTLIITATLRESIRAKPIAVSNSKVYNMVKDTAIVTVSNTLYRDTISNQSIATTNPDYDTTIHAYNRMETALTDSGINTDSKNVINAAAKRLLDSLPKMKPAQLNHINVSCTGPVFPSWNYIVVRDHKAVFTPFYDSL